MIFMLVWGTNGKRKWYGLEMWLNLIGVNKIEASINALRLDDKEAGAVLRKAPAICFSVLSCKEPSTQKDKTAYRKAFLKSSRREKPENQGAKHTKGQNGVPKGFPQV